MHFDRLLLFAAFAEMLLLCKCMHPCVSIDLYTRKHFYSPFIYIFAKIVNGRAVWALFVV